MHNTWSLWYLTFFFFFACYLSIIKHRYMSKNEAKPTTFNVRVLLKHCMMLYSLQNRWLSLFFLSIYLSGREIASSPPPSLTPQHIHESTWSFKMKRYICTCFVLVLLSKQEYKEARWAQNGKVLWNFIF